MRHIVPLAMLALAAVAFSEILLPSTVWYQSDSLRTIFAFGFGAICYGYGVRQHRNQNRAGASSSFRPQITLAGLLIATALTATLCAMHFNRARQQAAVVQAMQQRHFIGFQIYSDQSELHSPQPSLIFGGLETQFGFEYVHRLNAVDVYECEVEDAVPLLKQLPYLQTLNVTDFVGRMCIYDRGDEDSEPTAEEQQEAQRVQKRRSDLLERLRHELPHVDVQIKEVQSGIPVVG